MSLLAALLLAAAAPPAVRAGDDAGDYAHVSAPDLDQAERFFREALRCEPIAATDDDRLLACAHGAVVELSLSRHGASGAPIRLHADDVEATAAWLRGRNVPLIAGPSAGGLPPGELAVELRTPWGQPLTLVGTAGAGSRLAAQ